MNIAAIVQARMGSSRLPGKVLMDICGQSMLSRILERLSFCKSIQKIAVATSTSSEDSAVASECQKKNIPVFRGNESDVLDRYYHASRFFSVDAVVRITGDCPMIDPGVVDRVVNEFVVQGPDYASNTLHRTYPRGLDTEVVRMAALEKAWLEASEPYQRAHVTPYFYQNPKLFTLVSVTNNSDFSSYRWTVDTPEDLTFAQNAYRLFERRPNFSWEELVKALDQHPHIKSLNQGVSQKKLEEG